MTRNRTASYTVELEPAEGVGNERGRLAANSMPAWMRLRFAESIPAGRWLALTYRASYFDRLARPILRFASRQAYHDEFAPAPLFGRATWIGRVPDDTAQVLISPVCETGQFGFEIESCGPASWRDLVADALWRDRRRTLEAIGSLAIGRRGEARRLMVSALGGAPLARYHEWRAHRLRPFDVGGLDAPRWDWSTGPHIRLAVAATGADLDDIVRLDQQLAHQPYPHWSLAVIAGGALSLPARLEASIAAGRLRQLVAGDAVVRLADGLRADSLVGVVDAADALPPHALAVLAHEAWRRPASAVLYADDESIDAKGRHMAPRLYPDWSPTFEAAGGYIGRALFARCRLLARLEASDLGRFAAGGLKALLGTIAPIEIAHIRRVLLTCSHRILPPTADRALPARRRPPSVGNQSAVVPGPSAAAATPGPRAGVQAPAIGSRKAATGTDAAAPAPCATIIVPNKDQPELLGACLRGLAETTSPGGYEVIIVDNGSTAIKTRELYDSLKGDARFRVLERPGPFNFALLCNSAAEEARAPILLFLNNDIEVIEPGWLPPLLDLARQPDIGAVGAQLVYPSGELQHGGVVIGLAGCTGHVDRKTPPADCGYLGRRRTPHEVSAVTGACLAVAKAKFEAAGGFDAEHLPVELNDIDLCLRLAQRGWRTILAAHSVLVHHESASRGTSTAHSRRYRRERNLFRARWADHLRDDPYFHPALSLVSIRTALG